MQKIKTEEHPDANSAVRRLLAAHCSPKQEIKTETDGLDSQPQQQHSAVTTTTCPGLFDLPAEQNTYVDIDDDTGFSSTAIMQANQRELRDQVDMRAVEFADQAMDLLFGPASRQTQNTLMLPRRTEQKFARVMLQNSAVSEVGRKRRCLDGGDDETDESNASGASSSSSSSNPVRAPGAGPVDPIVMPLGLRVAVYSPFWTELFKDYGYPEHQRNCFGCKRGSLTNQRIADALYRQFIEYVIKNALSGIHSLILNAGPRFRTLIVEFMGDNIPEEDREMYELWCNGINPIYHCARHDMTEQLRQIFEVIEQQYYIDHVMNNELCSRDVTEPQTKFSVGKNQCDVLIKLKMLQTKVKQGEPKKSCTYQAVLGAGNARAGDCFRNFSGLSQTSRQQ